MGQCPLCGAKEESQQATAFVETSSSDAQAPHASRPHSSLPNGQQAALTFDHQPHASSAHGGHVLDPGSAPGGGELERLAADGDCQRRMAQYRLEQAELARREAIVAAASRSMVPVGPSQGASGLPLGGLMMAHHDAHRGGGINSYYDPAYAAAAAQDILRSAAATGGLVFGDDRATRAAMDVAVLGTVPAPASAAPANAKEILEMLGRGSWEGVRLGSRGSGLAGCGGEDPEYYLDDLVENFLETMVPTRTSMFVGCPSIVENLP